MPVQELSPDRGDASGGESPSSRDEVVVAARRAVAAAEAASEAARSHPSTPSAVKERIARSLEESRAVLQYAESTPMRRGRQSFAEFTTLLGEEVQQAAEDSMTEAKHAAERTLRQAKSLIEDHFHIDEAFRMLGPLRQDDNLARDIHDWFNLIALIPVNYWNFRNWSCLVFCSDMVGLRFHSVTELWHGEAFSVFWWITLAYFIADTTWMLALPNCVKSPKVILKHHVATIGYIFIPKLRPEHGWLMGACMIVEVNTWFLIARRALNKRGEKAFNTGVSLLKSIRVMLVSTCFYISWFLIRLVIYPYLLVVIIREYFKEWDKVGTPFNVIAITPIIQCVFLYLNVKWTIDLVRSKMKGRGVRVSLAWIVLEKVSKGL
eukprot:TRINITY_DN16108_c0_g1_i2.p1 TRINITY_DN16108_c0_g1~~TRINITY_DN16108_c0_g1_i2.p1  ORF type:complete len:378 (+),score=61.18 TRINITY_DN16108_c0_g1_i2:82-1215(+)